MVQIAAASGDFEQFGHRPRYAVVTTTIRLRFDGRSTEVIKAVTVT